METESEGLLGIDYEKLGLSFDNLDPSEANYISFTDTATVRQAKESKFGNADFTNDYEYSETPSIMTVKTYPDYALVNSVTVESSDPSVLEILPSQKDDDVCTVRVQAHKLGDAQLKLTVCGDKNTVVSVYDIRVCTTVELQFYINRYWIGGVSSRIRFKPKSLPLGAKEMLMEIKDSVSVIGYCCYYDFNVSREPQFVRDTTTYPMKDHYERFKKGKRILLRNVTDAVRKYKREMTHPGNMYDPASGQLRPTAYCYVPEQVIVDFCIVCDNPYYNYVFSTKYGYSTEHLVEGTEDVWVDEGSDEDEDENPDEEVQDFKKEDKQYFTIVLNDFLFGNDLKAMEDQLQQDIHDTGWSDNLTDEEKDSILDELNNKNN